MSKLWCVWLFCCCLWLLKEQRLFFWLSKIVSGIFFFCVRLVRFLKFFSSLQVESCCFVSMYVVENCLGVWVAGIVVLNALKFVSDCFKK